MLAQAIGVQPNGVYQTPPPENKMSQELAQSLLALLKLLTEFDGSLNQSPRFGSHDGMEGVIDEILKSLVKRFKQETELSEKGSSKILSKELKLFKKLLEILQALKGLAVILMALSSSKSTSTNEEISSLTDGDNSSPLDDILDTSLQKVVENTDNF